MVLDPLFYLIAVPAVLLTGIGKGGFGGGMGLISVPLMAMVVPPLQAAAILLPILCVMDLVGLWAYRRQWSALDMPIILIGGLAGTAIGWLTASHIDDRAVALIDGVIAVTFCLHHWLRRGGAPSTEPPNRGKGFFWSTLSGFTSFVTHAGAPPLMVYLMPRQMDRTLLQGTIVVYFAVINYVKLVPYGMLGQLRLGNLETAFVLAPLAPVGMLLGIWLHKRVSPALFYRLCYGLIFAAGLRLIWTGLGLSQ